MKVSVQYAAEPVNKRVLGAGKAISPLPDEDELERIDREWKREAFGDIDQPIAAEKNGDRALGGGSGELRVPSDREWEAMDKEWRESFEGKFRAGAARSSAG
jgi:hypothetical protein